MSRTIDAAVEPELDADPYRLLMMADLDFPSAPVYVHTGVGDIVFNSNTYKGVGDLGKVSAIEESAELQTFGLVMELSGVEPALISISLNDDIQGRACSLYIAFLDADLQVIDPPVGPWTGRMDVMDGELGEKGVLRLSVESRLADWERARIRRYTDADQQDEYPGDLFFEFTSQMQEKELFWGPKP